MFNIGFSELVVLAILGLLILGPDQLPQMARKLARIINDLKRATDEAMAPVKDLKLQAKEMTEKAREQARKIAEGAEKTSSPKKDSDEDGPSES